jgi:hypothetical protein
MRACDNDSGGDGETSGAFDLHHSSLSIFPFCSDHTHTILEILYLAIPGTIRFQNRAIYLLFFLLPNYPGILYFSLSFIPDVSETMNHIIFSLNR